MKTSDLIKALRHIHPPVDEAADRLERIVKAWEAYNAPFQSASQAGARRAELVDAIYGDTDAQ